MNVIEHVEKAALTRADIVRIATSAAPQIHHVGFSEKPRYSAIARVRSSIAVQLFGRVGGTAITVHLGQLPAISQMSEEALVALVQSKFSKEDKTCNRES